MNVSVAAPPTIDKRPALQRLQKKFDLDLVEDPARSRCEAHGFQTLYDMPEELQRRERRRLLEDHAARLQSDGLLFDHSAVEWLADWMRWFWSDTPTEEWEEILALGRTCVEGYDRLYHLPDGPRQTYDGYVWLDERNAEQVNGLMRYLYRRLDVTDRVHDLEEQEGP